MNAWINSLIEENVQCWGCAVFDKLFEIISNTAAAVYEKFGEVCVILFAFIFTAFVFNAVYQNFKKGVPDPFLQKSVIRVIITSFIALTLLGAGLSVPRFITTVTFEPVAEITLQYSQAMIKSNNDIVNEKVDYEPLKIEENGFFRPKLRDTIIMIMKTTITQFQSYMKLGVAVMDNAFSWKALLSVGSFIKHLLLFLIGLYIAWGFLKIFFKYCCYFADAIVAMAFFAFFFPISLVSIPFSGAEHVPKWISGIGKTVGVNQIKNLINAIVTLGSVVLTYTVIMVIIAKFFSAPDANVTNLMDSITSGQIFADDLNTDNLYTMSLIGCVALVYVLNYIFNQIPQVTKMVLGAFNVEENNKYGEQFANDIMTLTKKAFDNAVTVGKTIINGGETKDKTEKKDK